MDYLPVLEKGLTDGKVFLNISVDAGTEEMHAKIKQVRTYKRVWNNIKKYASFQKNPNQVKIKYNIVPDVNDLENEIKLWLKLSKDAGIKNVCAEIESSYFEQNRNNIPDKIYKLFYFAKKEAEKSGLKFTLYDRASHMMSENPKHKDFWKNYLNNC